MDVLPNGYMKKYDYSFIIKQFIKDMNPSRKERGAVIKYVIKKIFMHL